MILRTRTSGPLSLISALVLLAALAFLSVLAPAALAQDPAPAPAAAQTPAAVGPAPPAAVQTGLPPAPAIAARGAILINADDGTVLFSLNADQRFPMASTTKMMTALIIVEENLDDMNEPVVCSQRAAEIGESSIWLTAGEKLTVKEMLMGLLIQSGNDAATALAEYNAGSMELFVEKMNRRAAELGLNDTHFMNPHGLDEPDHYTSAADFARLGKEVMRHAEIRDLVGMQEAAVPWTGHPYNRSLVNHNHLLFLSSAVNGIKTGYTDGAGQCIVVSATQDGTNLILSYLGGESLERRDEDVLNLLGFGFASYRDEKVITAGSQYGDLNVPLHSGREMALVADSDLVKKVYTGNTIEHRIVLPEDVELPISKGDKVGLVEAFEGQRYLGSSYLLATEDVEAPDFSARINYYIEAVYNFIF